MNENSTNEIKEVEKMLIERSRFESLISNLSEKNFDEVKELISNFLDTKIWLQKLIIKISFCHPLSYKIYGNLFELTGKPVIKFWCMDLFARYLYARGLIECDDFDSNGPPSMQWLESITDYETPLKEDTLEYYIYTDNVQKFADIITSDDIDITESYPFIINDYRFSNIASLTCFCGSLKILKYLIINNVKITKQAILKAFRNGSEEVIEFLHQKGYPFTNCLETAIRYHHNDIAKWLVDNYNDKYFFTPYCVVAMNTEMLLFFINALNKNINEQDLEKKTCLHYAVMNNDILLTKYLLLKGIDKSIIDFSGQTAFQKAYTEEMKKLFE